MKGLEPNVRRSDTAAIHQAHSQGSGPCDFTRCLKGVRANLHQLEGGPRIGFARRPA